MIWLGFQITPTDITPTKKKCNSINKLETPKTLKQLSSFMGCLNHLIKFTEIRNISNCMVIRTLQILLVRKHIHPTNTPPSCTISIEKKTEEIKHTKLDYPGG